MFEIKLISFLGHPESHFINVNKIQKKLFTYHSIDLIKFYLNTYA